MVVSKVGSTDRHVRQEAQANEFAIELLAPRPRVRAFLNGGPGLHRVLQMAQDLDISREAAARRYVELHDDDLAVVICREAKFIYASRSAEFPSLLFGKGQPVPIVASRQGAQMSDTEDVVADEWLHRSQGCELTAQTFHQQNDFSMTLLCVSRNSAEDETGLENTYDRLLRLSDGR